MSQIKIFILNTHNYNMYSIIAEEQF